MLPKPLIIQTGGRASESTVYATKDSALWRACTRCGGWLTALSVLLRLGSGEGERVGSMSPRGRREDACHSRTGTLGPRRCTNGVVHHLPMGALAHSVAVVGVVTTSARPQ